MRNYCDGRGNKRYTLLQQCGSSYTYTLCYFMSISVILININYQYRYPVKFLAGRLSRMRSSRVLP
jgi:hypothetical protein